MRQGDFVEMQLGVAAPLRNCAAPSLKQGKQVCDEMIALIAELHAIEKTIRSKAPETRRTVRQQLSRPLVEALRPWLEARLQEVSSASDLARHIRYGPKRWEGLIRFLDDGRLEMDTNGVENAIRPVPPKFDRIGGDLVRLGSSGAIGSMV